MRLVDIRRLDISKAGLAIAFGLVLAIALYTTVPKASADDVLHYESKNCKTDAKGMVYVAAGREVFRWPEADLLSIRNVPRKEVALLPKVPDPTELEGCPLHPIQGLSFVIRYPYEPTTQNDGKTTNRRKDFSFEIISVASNYFGSQTVTEMAFKKICDTWHFETRPLPNFTACAGSKVNPLTPDRVSGVYQSDVSSYSAPFERPYMVECLQSAIELDCDVSYKYLLTVNLVYKFSMSDLPPSEWIAFDKALRKKADEARVRDFVWPE